MRTFIHKLYDGDVSVCKRFVACFAWKKGYLMYFALISLWVHLIVSIRVISVFFSNEYFKNICV